MAKELKVNKGGSKRKENGTESRGASSKMVNPSTMDDIDDDVSTSGSEDEDDHDVSKKGLARLMKALGDDGLTDMDKAHLQMVAQMVAGEEGSDEDEEDDVSVEDDDEAEDDEEGEDLEEDDLEGESLESGSIGNELEEVHAQKPTASSTTQINGKDSLAASLARSGLIAEEEFDEEEIDEEEDDKDDDGDEEGIPLDSMSNATLAALPESVRATRMYREKINNKEALNRIRQDIALGSDSKKGSLPWIETLVVDYNKSIEEELGVLESSATDDDLKRELEFYKQALYTAVQGRQLAKQADLAFTRPSDYFAEMVKSDEHMERVRQKLLDERAGLKASEEAKRQRELKKFGKKVQVEKQIERTKSRKELDDKVKGLKRKRKGGLDGDDNDDDNFDVQLESAISGKGNKRSRNDNTSRGGRGSSSRGRGGSKMNRDARDAKYGHGGKKRFSKENTRESTNDTSSAGVYRGRGGSRGSIRGGSRGRGSSGSRGAKRGASQRPGKARRSGSGR